MTSRNLTATVSSRLVSFSFSSVFLSRPLLPFFSPSPEKKPKKALKRPSSLSPHRLLIVFFRFSLRNRHHLVSTPHCIPWSVQYRLFRLCYREHGSDGRPGGSRGVCRVPRQGGRQGKTRGGIRKERWKADGRYSVSRYNASIASRFAPRTPADSASTFLSAPPTSAS